MNNERKLSRQQKIKLLHDIMSGKVSIKEAFPQPLQIWYCQNGTYSGGTGEHLTEEDFKAKKFNGPILVFREQEGNDPIIDI